MRSTKRTFYNMVWGQEVTQSQMSGQPGEQLQNSYETTLKAESSYRVASRVSPHTGHIVVSRYLASGSSLRLLMWVLFM